MNPTRRKGARFRDQMFAAAEADLEPDVIDRPVEAIRQIGWAGAGDIQREPRQQSFDQIGLMEAKLMTLATAEK